MNFSFEISKAECITQNSLYSLGETRRSSTQPHSHFSPLFQHSQYYMSTHVNVFLQPTKTEVFVSKLFNSVLKKFNLLVHVSAFFFIYLFIYLFFFFFVEQFKTVTKF